MSSIPKQVSFEEKATFGQLTLRVKDQESFLYRVATICDLGYGRQVGMMFHHTTAMEAVLYVPNAHIFHFCVCLAVHKSPFGEVRR